MVLESRAMRRMGAADRGGRQRTTGGEGLCQNGPAKHTVPAGVSRHASSRVALDWLLGDSSGLASTRSLLWRSVLLGWLPTRRFRLCSRSLVDLAGPRVTVPRASPRRGAAVWAPLHSVCVLLARPMFRGTRLPGACYVVHLVVSRRSADCGAACWARAHRGTAHADVLLR